MPLKKRKIAESETAETQSIGDIEDGAHTNIERDIEIIGQMRQANDAPVDTMGCHMLADVNADPKTYRFQTLVALMLSSQTKDQVTAAAMKFFKFLDSIAVPLPILGSKEFSKRFIHFFDHSVQYPWCTPDALRKLKEHGCTADQIIEFPENDLADLLNPVGFYKRKAHHLKKTAIILKNKFDSDVPDTLEGLLSLPGVGPKMAHLTLQIAFDKTEGIGVDTHVHRIVNRLKWVNTKMPTQTEQKLAEILPRNQWRTINKLLVGFGQQICLPVKPKCFMCLNKEFCPFNKKSLK